MHIRELKYAYSIAGMRVLSNRPASLGKVYTGTDGEVKVIFVEKAVNLAELAGAPGMSSHPEEWLPWIDRSGVTVISSKDGKTVLIRDRDHAILDYAAFLRQMIPFASALQNKPVLHASAVRFEDRIVAFIGASGVGKSTLASHCHGLGFLPVTDDLLPVHVGPQAALIPLAGGTKTSPNWLPLTRIYFISRDPSLEQMQITALSKMEHLLLHLRNGYSELSIANIWRTQFSSCSKIVDLVEAFQLTLPDDIDYLPEAVKILSEIIFAAGEPDPILSPTSRAERTIS